MERKPEKYATPLGYPAGNAWLWAIFWDGRDDALTSFAPVSLAMGFRPSQVDRDALREAAEIAMEAGKMMRRDDFRHPEVVAVAHFDNSCEVALPAKPPLVLWRYDSEGNFVRKTG